MPNLHVCYNPPLTRHFVRAGAFSKTPLVVVDVGARGGIESHWEVFGADIRVIAFDPDPEECKRLSDGGNVQYLPYAISKAGGPQKFHIANYAASSSLYPNRQEYVGRFTHGDVVRVVSEETIKTVTLAEALKRHGIEDADFIKLDVEGAELDVLQGSGLYLSGIVGIVSEVRFSRQLSGCPVYWEMEAFCQEHGFELYDLDVYRHSRKALPYPHLYDFRDQHGSPVIGPTTQGQAFWGDALYFRESVPEAKLVKLVCLFEVFGLNDCAAELMLSHPDIFERGLLDLLVPEVKGQRLTYADYLSRYNAGDRLFRPTYGRRFPEQMLSQYDGVFTPAWNSKPLSFLRRLARRLRRAFG